VQKLRERKREKERKRRNERVQKECRKKKPSAEQTETQVVRKNSRHPQVQAGGAGNVQCEMRRSLPVRIPGRESGRWRARGRTRENPVSSRKLRDLESRI